MSVDSPYEAAYQQGNNNAVTQGARLFAVWLAREMFVQREYKWELAIRVDDQEFPQGGIGNRHIVTAAQDLPL